MLQRAIWSSVPIKRSLINTRVKGFMSIGLPLSRGRPVTNKMMKNIDVRFRYIRGYQRIGYCN